MVAEFRIVPSDRVILQPDGTIFQMRLAYHQLDREMLNFHLT